MPENILIAALGEHPAVVTGMVKALREVEGLEIDTLHVLHTEDSGKDISALCYPLVEIFLEDQCSVFPYPLPFADPNTREKSVTFLQSLTGLLSQYSDPGRYRVYLSLAGGRKNMSALMALVTQFFPAVRGLYHLLDRREGPRAGFPSCEEIDHMPTEQQWQTFDPPLEYLNLVSIPYPGAFANHSELWHFLKTFDVQDEQPSISLPPEAEVFFRAVFDPGKRERPLEVWLSQTAYDQYHAWAAQGSHYAGEFLTCFKQMREPRRLRDRIHGTFGEYHFYKRPRTRERPFFYTEPNPIHMYPNRSVDQVVVCGLAVEQGNGQYKPAAEELLLLIDRQPYKQLSELEERDLVLLVPLGKSPMIATQTYTLLHESEEEGRPNIPTVAVLYPQCSAIIRNGVRMLRKQFERRDVEFIEYPIDELRDVDSETACKTYLRDLLSTIDDLRSKYPDRELALSLSGGRKGMSALTLFAAQRAGIERLYHTLIKAPDLEERVEEETTLAALDKLATDDDRARRLFLQAYDSDQFELFPIPIIPFAG